MNWNEMESAWNRQVPPGAAGTDVKALIETFEARRRKLAANLLWRDLREAGAGLVGAAVLGYLGLHRGPGFRTCLLAIAPMLGVTAFFILERIRAHRERPGFDAPLLTKLEADLAELRHQRRLLSSVGTWYLAPLSAGIAAMLAALYFSLPGPVRERGLVYFAGCLAATALLFWGVWALNRRAVRKGVEPAIIELERLRDQFSQR